jgi:hypothetical protein
MKVYKDRRDEKPTRDIPDERLDYQGSAQGLDVWRDSKTGRRYIGMWGRSGVLPITQKELQEMAL